MAKGDDMPRLPNGRSHGLFKDGSGGMKPKERREARRSAGVIAARRAIGAETAEDAKSLIAHNKELRDLYYKVLDSLN